MNTAEIITLAQLMIAGAGLGAEQVDVHLYQAFPDFELLDQLRAGDDKSKIMEGQPEDGWLAFVFSKPGVEAGQVQVHGFAPLDDQGEPTGELWVKLKSMEGLAHENLLENSGEITPAHRINAKVMEILQTAVEIKWLDDREVISGPAWLKSPIKKLFGATTFIFHMIRLSGL